MTDADDATSPRWRPDKLPAVPGVSEITGPSGQRVTAPQWMRSLLNGLKPMILSLYIM